MKKEPFIITIILFGVLFALLIIYLGLTNNVTYDKVLKELSTTTKITIKESLTLEQLVSSKAYNEKITSKKQIKKIVNYIASGKNDEKECWHDLPRPDYEVKFYNKNNKLLAEFSVMRKDNHIHLVGDGFDYSIYLDVEKLIKLLAEQE